MFEPIVTEERMRAVEAAALAGGVPAADLMERAGRAAARAILAFAGRADALVLCGPGNNGGDGYVVARVLREMGCAVRVAALGEPGPVEAKAARSMWNGPVEPLDGATAAAPLLIDALFGIGLKRPLAAPVLEVLHRLGGAARTVIAIDLPSGASTDDGALLSEPLRAGLTVTFGAPKPAHLLQPAAGYMGRIVVAGIGLAPGNTRLFKVVRPALARLTADAHKFARGHVAVAGGPAHATGAARLSALAAQRAGAGYVTLLSPKEALAANAAQLTSVVLREADDLAAAFERADAIAIGPALGAERGKVMTALVSGKPIVLDADVFTIFAGDGAGLANAITGPAVLTPHEGEFRRLFGELPGSKPDRVRAAAAMVGAVVLLKGADTVVAAPDGRAAICAHGTADLATAGTGDVLTGIIAALLARGLPPFEAACAGAWFHAEAGRLAGRGLVAEDLIARLPAAMA